MNKLVRSPEIKIPGLLLIAGNGNKSGKTTLACRIIEQSGDRSIVGVKITPHFHETTPGLVLLKETSGYAVYEETNRETGKDTSRMLKAGASKVYFAKVTDNDLLSAFMAIMDFVPQGAPVVCESPALRHFVVPGLFMIMKSDGEYNNKDINSLLQLPHVMFKLEELEKIKKLPLRFEGGSWIEI